MLVSQSDGKSLSARCSVGVRLVGGGEKEKEKEKEVSECVSE